MLRLTEPAKEIKTIVYERYVKLVFSRLCLCFQQNRITGDALKTKQKSGSLPGVIILEY